MCNQICCGVIWQHTFYILSVRSPFHCYFEANSACVLEQSNDDDDDGWSRIPAGVDSSRAGYDHTTLSG